MDEAERRLGHRLPADLRALYLMADGDGVGHDHRHLFGQAWLSLESMVAESTGWGAAERPWYGWDLEWDAIVHDASPADTVRRCGGHPGWLRFASGEDGNFLAVDMAPARAGHPGQVIATGRDYQDGPAYLTDSLTSLLGQRLELLDQGAYEKYDDHIALFPPDPGPPPREFVGGPIPEEVPPTLQAIHVNDVTGLVDLSPLTAAPQLRRLHLNRCATADLSPVRDLPVEDLRVTLADGDLAPLQAHPHLTSLSLTSTAPTDIAVLRTLPRLRSLDLSGADVPGLPALADLPGLRYLSLDARQWNSFLNDAEPPPTLAAARLAGPDVSLDDALAWAARLGIDTDDTVRVTGTLRRRA
ncbi:SMI1/KNR4 family protein [Streptomyces sp. G45]|uniref:SMI1/KNR4 family protein n=1 Tax=Streptomyces sp. G45 TaxID=3406627 RepID=UPI003C2A98EC